MSHFRVINCRGSFLFLDKTPIPHPGVPTLNLEVLDYSIMVTPSLALPPFPIWEKAQQKENLTLDDP
jgi:hypothetical protein